MFFEFAYHVMSLDLAWLASLIMGNLHWLFAFAACCAFFFGDKWKKIAVGTFLLSVVAWTWVDFGAISGWVLFVGGFLSIYYITKIVVLAFAENVPSMNKHLVIISELQFLVLLVAYNFFMR